MISPESSSSRGGSRRIWSSTSVRWTLVGSTREKRARRCISTTRRSCIFRTPRRICESEPPGPRGSFRFFSTCSLTFTASSELRGKLERLQALMNEDLATVIEAAVTEKLEKLEAKRFGVTKRSRKSFAESDTSRSRHIPAAVRRLVFERDRGQCTNKVDCVSETKPVYRFVEFGSPRTGPPWNPCATASLRSSSGFRFPPWWSWSWLPRSCGVDCSFGEARGAVPTNSARDPP